MSGRRPDWTPQQVPGLSGEGLRERKKRLMRQQLSDTATAMFLDRGFDGVRVADVAAACGVAEKTVFNYFPVKESLLLDRWDTTMASLRDSVACAGVPPVDAVRAGLDGELTALVSWLASQPDVEVARGRVLRFGEMVGSTPAL